MMKTIHVVCALIYDENHRIYASQRGYGEMKDGWEFPGGKIESGESEQEALKREILEEFDTEVCVEEKLCTIEHTYSSFHLVMSGYWCSIVDGHLIMKEAEAGTWITKQTLDTLDWLEADRKIAAQLKQIEWK